MCLSLCVVLCALSLSACVCCVCVRACVRACVRVCACVCEHMYKRESVCVFVHAHVGVPSICSEMSMVLYIIMYMHSEGVHCTEE